MRSDLESLAALLTQITVNANQAHEATHRLKTSTQETLPSLQTLPSLLASVSEKATSTAHTVTTTLTDLHQKTDQTHQHIATRFDDLQEALKDHTSLWNKAVSELLDAVKIGAVPVRQLLDLYGDAQIGGQKLADYLRGLDFSSFRSQINDFIQGLHQGTTEIAEVQAYLGQTQLLFAKQLNDVIDLFRQGRITLKRVQEIVSQIEKAFPDSQFADLAQALAYALRNGS